jgi:hypothetical protein
MRQVYSFKPGLDPVLLGSLEEFLELTICGKKDKDFGVIEIDLDGGNLFVADNEVEMWMYAGECNALRDDYQPIPTK